MDKTIALIDIDGVINHATRFSGRYAADYSVSPSALAPFFTGPFQECLTGQRDLKQELAPILSSWGWKGTVEELLHYWFAGEINPQPEVVAEIKRMHNSGIRCIGASNQEKYRLQYLRQSLGLDDYFDQLHSSADLGCKKPEPEFYKALLERSGAMPEEIIYWDDDTENVTAAQALGLTSYLFKDSESFIQQAKQLQTPA